MAKQIIRTFETDHTCTLINRFGFVIVVGAIANLGYPLGVYDTAGKFYSFCTLEVEKFSVSK
jgi:hypothetical protein